MSDDSDEFGFGRVVVIVFIWVIMMEKSSIMAFNAVSAAWKFAIRI